ncbi:MAG: recombinase family protein, partial [Magnetococcales bacterium]|nr:recombinase family protein [Magnetococcales bacterium]
EAQREAVNQYVKNQLGMIHGEHVEVETGKGANALTKRPRLQEAITQAKKKKATLIVAKLDRLARNVYFISSLMESNVQFVCADMPEANQLTIHIMAAMGQYERQMISERTRSALAAARARGVVLGNPRIDELNVPRREDAQVFAEGLRATIMAFQAAGLSQRNMVVALNDAGVTTFRGGRWSLVQLQRVIGRL